MRRLCPQLPPTPIPPHWHFPPHSRWNSLGNRGTVVRDLAPCHWLMVSPCPQLWADRVGVGCGSWWGWGLWGAIGMSCLGVCCLRMGVLSRCPHGYHLPCHQAAMSVPGLGLMVPLGHPQWIRIQGQIHPTKPGQCSTAQVLHRDDVNTLATCLAFPSKVKISF